MADAPIGIFDSGVGGLTVARSTYVRSSIKLVEAVPAASLSSQSNHSDRE